jgi:hypothetical protein
MCANYPSAKSKTTLAFPSSSFWLLAAVNPTLLRICISLEYLVDNGRGGLI